MILKLQFSMLLDYFTYAGYSRDGNRLGYYKLFMVFLYEMFSLVLAVGATYAMI